ncbi:MAG: hypothetical protein QXN82_05305, partial [Desulfurococcaceae archaeon]
LKIVDSPTTRRSGKGLYVLRIRGFRLPRFKVCMGYGLKAFSTECSSYPSGRRGDWYPRYLAVGNCRILEAGTAILNRIFHYKM